MSLCLRKTDRIDRFETGFVSVTKKESSRRDSEWTFSFWERRERQNLRMSMRKREREDIRERVCMLEACTENERGCLRMCERIRERMRVRESEREWERVWERVW